MKTDRCKKRGVFRYLCLGDVHLGHPQTPTRKIIHNLKHCITDLLLKEIDMLIIEGDLFHQLLTAGDENLFRIQAWITLLEARCAAFDVTLVILKGTPSHDWDQPKFFVEQAANAKIPVDLLYVTELSIHYFEKFDSYFLFVPDKCRTHTDIILRDVKAMLAAKGLEQVDFAVMHGMFEYQLPYAEVEEPSHNAEAYLEIVRHYIMIGHVHQRSDYQRILAAGSFDRLCHNDEGIKGFYDVSVRESGNNEIVFRENAGAKRYDTIDCHDLTAPEVNNKVKQHLKGLPAGSAVRIRCNQFDPATGCLPNFRLEFPNLEWTLTHEKSKKKKISVVDTLAAVDLSEFIPIEKNTLLDLLRPELEKHTKDPLAIERCLGHMAKFL